MEDSEIEPPRKQGDNASNGKRPLTKREVIAKAKELFGPRPRGPLPGHDKWGLFVEWVRTDKSQYPSARQWLKARHPEMHPMTINTAEGWGGFTFWNLARDAFHREAMRKLIEKTPNIIVKRFEKLLLRQDELEDVLGEIIQRIKRDLKEAENASDDPVKDRQVRRDTTAFNVRLIESLKDVQNGLADVANKLSGNPNAGTPQISQPVNFYAVLMDSMRERDERHGVIDAKVDRPPR